MFRPNTVFILGAAASLDFGFPLGSKFKADISRFLRIGANRGRDVFSAENDLFFSYFRERRNGAVQAARQIHGGVGFTASIDNFLHMRGAEPDIVECGKAAIAHLLLRKEVDCNGLRADGTHFSRLGAASFDGKWLQTFAEICFQDCRREEIPEALSRIRVISFNYDRCFEQFVRIAIAKLYNIDFEEADAICVGHLVGLHPYGCLGSLSLRMGRDDYVMFGDETPRCPIKLSGQLRTFTESTQSDYRPRAEGILEQANTIVSLGFGYHSQNLELLRITGRHGRKRFLGTSMGLSEAATRITEQNLVRVLAEGGDGLSVELYPCSCFELLNQHRLSLVDG